MTHQDSSHVVAILGRWIVHVDVHPAGRNNDPNFRADDVDPLDASVETIAYALAAGIEYKLRQRPWLLADARSPKAGQAIAKKTGAKGDGAMVAMRKVTWAPLTALKAAGAQVSWNPKTNRAVIAAGVRRLEVRACQNYATLGGKKYDLGGVALVGKDGPIVPLRKVADLLGLSVESRGGQLVVTRRGA